MRILIDTHAFLWAAADDPKLSPHARALLQDGSNDVYLSAASAWEIAIKYKTGRLPIDRAPRDYVLSRSAFLQLTPLDVNYAHAFCVADLPPIHADPFDRMLVAQAIVERMPILTDDSHIGRYDVEVIW